MREAALARLMPVSKARTACARVMAGSCKKFRVPYATLRLTTESSDSKS